MAKRVQEVSLETRTARMKLAPRHKPYFRLIGDGLHLGYRRSTVPRRAGSWLGRRYLGEERYETQAIGAADDLPDLALAEGVLNFNQAQAAVRDWARSRVAAARASEADEAALTVRQAVQAYVEARKARAAKAGRDAELRLTHHVLNAPLADIVLLELRERDLAAWRSALKRGGRGVKADAPAMAPATLARLLNDLRAALTAGARKARAPADLFTTITEGMRPPAVADRARVKQVLTDADVRRVVQAAQEQDADFGALVLLMAATGARMDQLTRVTVADLQPEQRRVMIPTSHKGLGKKQVPHIAVPLPDDVIAQLRPLLAGRHSHEPLLMRWHHRQARGEDAGSVGKWVRDERRPWTSPAEMTRPWHAAIAAAGLPDDLVPYSLRHSAIVRGLRAGLPVRLVAAVHDTSTAMIEKHYGAFIVDASEDLLRRAVVPFAAPPVAPLRRVG